MKKRFRKAAAFALATVLTAMTVLPHIDSIVVADEDSTSQTMPYRDLTADELVEEMGLGWNLGNTMDGHTGFTPNETLWQNVKTTKQTIKGVHDLGFNTVRIPVTWGTMINDDYSINENWISRVQDIVDYCISEDMYVIINIHHDGAEQTGWLRIATDDKEALYDKFGGVWKTIATYFKDYDEHLIFEAMNEVKGEKMTLAEENQVIMDLNQIFVDTIRSTGGNNDNRWLVVCGKYNYIDSLVNDNGGWKLPEDSATNKLIASCHVYTPWSFCGSTTDKTGEYTIDKFKSTNLTELKNLKELTDAGIPVIVGEYGCMNRMSADGDGFNSSDRALYLEAMNQTFKEIGAVGIYWDQGWYDRSMSPDYSFSIVDRATGETIDKEVTDAMVRGYYKTLSLANIVESPTIAQISDIAVTDKLELTVGEYYTVETAVTPAVTNDVVLYSTDNCDIATVYNGKIHAKSVGTTTINVYSQSGSVEKQISVTVKAAASSVACDDITYTEVTEVIGIDKAVYLDASIATEGCDAYLTYQTSDASVASVSPIGKIVGVGEGTATISIISSDGYVETLDMKVTNSSAVNSITLALNVYYNDNKNEYWGNEYSDATITVSESGQYTLTFDCSKDLSDTAKAAGVSTLSRLTAIYIKDHDVTLGNATVSPLESCDIMYNKIVVDGVELTITQTEPKSALKSSGIFDTNDPINSWDGSAVEEVSCISNIASFVDMDPTTIEVTFTLTNMQFKGADKLPDAVIDNTTNDVIDESVDVDDSTEADTSGADNQGGKFPVEAIVVIVLGVVALLIAGGATIYVKKCKEHSDSQ